MPVVRDLPVAYLEDVRRNEIDRLAFSSYSAELASEMAGEAHVGHHAILDDDSLNDGDLQIRNGCEEGLGSGSGSRWSLRTPGRQRVIEKLRRYRRVQQRLAAVRPEPVERINGFQDRGAFGGRNIPGGHKRFGHRHLHRRGVVDLRCRGGKRRRHQHGGREHCNTHVILLDGCVPTSPSTAARRGDRKSTRLNSSHPSISYAVFCLKKKNVLAAYLQSA